MKTLLDDRNSSVREKSGTGCSGRLKVIIRVREGSGIVLWQPLRGLRRVVRHTETIQGKVKLKVQGVSEQEDPAWTGSRE